MSFFELEDKHGNKQRTEYTRGSASHRRTWERQTAVLYDRLQALMDKDDKIQWDLYNRLPFGKSQYDVAGHEAEIRAWYRNVETYVKSYGVAGSPPFLKNGCKWAEEVLDLEVADCISGW